MRMRVHRRRTRPSAPDRRRRAEISGAATLRAPALGPRPGAVVSPVQPCAASPRSPAASTRPVLLSRGPADSTQLRSLASPGREPCRAQPALVSERSGRFRAWRRRVRAAQVGLGLRFPVRSPPAIYLQQCLILLVELRGFEPLTSAVRLLHYMISRAYRRLPVAPKPIKRHVFIAVLISLVYRE
jgi:hypothetical protein